MADLDKNINQLPKITDFTDALNRLVGSKDGSTIDGAVVIAELTAYILTQVPAGSSEWIILSNILSNITKTVDYVSVYADSVEVARFGDGVDPKFIVDPSGTFGATTGIWYGGDSAIYETGSGFLRFKAGNRNWDMSNTTFGAAAVGALLSSNTPGPTAANHSFVGDTNTGVGTAGADMLSHIAGGIEARRYEEASGHIIEKAESNTGITANTTQTQGQTPLLSSFNEISTVANANDVVTMPNAKKDYLVTIVNNGANTLQIFPASGDDLGAGVNNSITLASGATDRYWAYDITNWATI